MTGLGILTVIGTFTLFFMKTLYSQEYKKRTSNDLDSQYEQMKVDLYTKMLIKRPRKEEFNRDIELLIKKNYQIQWNSNLVIICLAVSCLGLFVIVSGGFFPDWLPTSIYSTLNYLFFLLVALTIIFFIKLRQF